MAWILKYDIVVPFNLVRAHFLVLLDNPKIELHEREKGIIEIHPKIHFLFSRHPLTSISKGEIMIRERTSNITEIQITLHKGSLQGFAILFPVLFILIVTFFGYWVTNIPLKEILQGIWTIHLCIIASSILIYLLIKQAVIRYFNQIVDRARHLID